jgi:hypothetical protein
MGYMEVSGNPDHATLSGWSASNASLPRGMTSLYCRAQMRQPRVGRTSYHAVTILALMTLFSAQFRDCLPTSDHQSMRCCGSESCNPANHSHDYCKTTVTPDTFIGLATPHIASAAPVVLVIDQVSFSEAPVFPGPFYSEFEVRQHSPPKLYTLHSLLRI